MNTTNILQLVCYCQKSRRRNGNKIVAADDAVNEHDNGIDYGTGIFIFLGTGKSYNKASVKTERKEGKYEAFAE